MQQINSKSTIFSRLTYFSKYVKSQITILIIKFKFKNIIKSTIHKSEFFLCWSPRSRSHQDCCTCFLQVVTHALLFYSGNLICLMTKRLRYKYLKSLVILFLGRVSVEKIISLQHW